MGGILAAKAMSAMYEGGADVGAAILTAIVIAMVSSSLCGMLNGYIVAYIGAPAMMATLGTSTLFEGIGLLVSMGNSISGFPTEFFWFGNGTVLGIPVPMIIFLIIAAITFLLLEHTSWGLSVYMVGCNPTAARFSGINVKKVMMKVYIYSGFLGSIATIIMMSRYNSARIDYGSSYLMQTVTAAVLGGTVITGGYGKVIGCSAVSAGAAVYFKRTEHSGARYKFEYCHNRPAVDRRTGRELHKRYFRREEKAG